jgi:glyoxylase I family protein
MEKVTGIGGLFFRAEDPAAPGRWYQEHLGVTMTPTSYEELPWWQEAGPSGVSPFPWTTEYFGDAKQMWMVNFRVRDLDAIRGATSGSGPCSRGGRAVVPERPLCPLVRPGGQSR